MKIRSTVALENAGDIRWLVIESDEHDTHGFFLYSYLTETFAYDTWYRTLDEAFSAAFVQFGVDTNNWEQVKDTI